MCTNALTQLSDTTLLQALAALVVRDRETTAALLAHLAEVDARQLYSAAAFPSMHAYCVGELRMAEEVAFKRLRAARAAREFPQVLPAVADGRLNLTAVVLLARHLTTANADALLAQAVHRSRVEVEALVAGLAPRLDVPTRVGTNVPSPSRELDLDPVRMTHAGQSPSPGAAHAPETPSPPARVAPLAPTRYELAGTMDQAMYDDLRAAQALLGHEGRDAMAVLARGLALLRRQLERRRCAATASPRRRRANGDGRTIPAEVRRAVWDRDRGRCTFTSDSGRRCEAHGDVEFDHVQPVARGGRSTVDDLRLRCRAHNQLEAERTFGAGFMASKREAARQQHERRDTERRERERTREQDRACRAAARAERERARARQECARAQAAALRAEAEAVVPFLVHLGAKRDRALETSMRAVADAGPTLEERLKYALRLLAPPHTKTPAPTRSDAA